MKKNNKKDYDDKNNLEVEKTSDNEIRVLSADDEKIKVVGEVLANESSRAILRLLSNMDEMTINQIAQEMDLSIPLVSHHLKKMQETGVVKVNRVGKSVKGQKMNYYSITNQSFLITPPEKQTHSLFHSLRKFAKFAAIGMAGLVSWAMLEPKSDNQLVPIDDAKQTDFSENEVSEEEWSSASELTDETESELTEPTSSAPRASEAVPEHEPEPAPEPEPEPEPYRPDEGFDLKVDSDGADAGTISLDRTVYPEPFATSGAESVDPLVLSIIIPIVVIAGGIIIERILTRWYHKRKVKISA